MFLASRVEAQRWARGLHVTDGPQVELLTGDSWPRMKLALGMLVKRQGGCN